MKEMKKVDYDYTGCRLCVSQGSHGLRPEYGACVRPQLTRRWSAKRISSLCQIPKLHSQDQKVAAQYRQGD